MSTRQALYALYLVLFLAFSTWAFARADVWPLIVALFENPVSLQVAVDLGTSMTILLGFIWQDARKRGISPWPYVVLGVLAGSISPLIYLIHRGFRPERAAA